MGHFVDFKLPYGTKPRGLDSKYQAEQVVSEARKRISKGSDGVSITYSANYGQTKLIHKTYKKGDWNTHTSGSNQADVMREMETLLGSDASDLQGKLQIAPITTLTYESDKYGDYTHEEVVQQDLDYIKSLLDTNWDVLGWKNQDSETRYAIGGGVKKNLPENIENLIQNTLKKYAQDYSKQASTLATSSYNLPTPKPGSVTIDGQTYTFLAFYYPGKPTPSHPAMPWDLLYKAPFMGNFYECDFSVTIDGITGTFQNAESAYQATKWWNDAGILKQFENAKTGDDAFHLKRSLERSGSPENRCSLNRRDAMVAVCTGKFSIPEFKKALLSTGDAYLLEHNSKKGRDHNWSDDNDGTGNNWLGLSLMKVRKNLGGNGAPMGSYTVKDFTDQVKKDIA